MSEYAINISNLNDFIFCPISLYFHNLVSNEDKISAQDTYQINGTAAHEKSDNGTYSDRKNVLQAVSVYSEKYDLIGKIDTFDIVSGKLTERKKKIKKIYDGYIFQLYAQYFSLTEMGYNVKELCLYSMDDNKTYIIDLPDADLEMFKRFESIIREIKEFDVNSFIQTNQKKCDNCIYEPLCAYSLGKKEGEL